MSDVFISYKQEERERMRPIADGLRALGVNVWFDERLSPDRPFSEEIDQVMRACRAQLVCWSPSAIRSQWVLGEADIGRRLGSLVQIMIERCDLPAPFNMIHAENMSEWTGDPEHPGWQKVLETIGRKINRPGLGRLAVVQGSRRAEEWKKWASTFPSDQFADEAWAKAEELHIDAERERFAKQRQSARLVAKGGAKRIEAAEPPDRIPPAESIASADHERRFGFHYKSMTAIATTVMVTALVGVMYLGGAHFWSRLSETGPNAAAVTAYKAIQEIEQANIQLARQYFREIKDKVNNYIDETYAPQLVTSVLRRVNLAPRLTNALARDDGNQVLQIMQISLEELIKQVELKRAQVLEPIADSEAQLIQAIQESFARVKRAQSAAFGEPEATQDQLLTDVGLSSLRSRFLETTAQVSDSISDSITASQGLSDSDAKVQELDKAFGEIAERFRSWRAAIPPGNQ